MTEVIRIFMADDHAIVRKGIQTLIATEPGMEMVGEADNGRDAVELALQLKPDVILMDMVMPMMDGIEAITRITKEDIVFKKKNLKLQANQSVRQLQGLKFGSTCPSGS